MAKIDLSESEISQLSSLLVEMRSNKNFEIKNFGLSDRSIYIIGKEIELINSILDKLYKKI